MAIGKWKMTIFKGRLAESLLYTLAMALQVSFSWGPCLFFRQWITGSAIETGQMIIFIEETALSQPWFFRICDLSSTGYYILLTIFITLCRLHPVPCYSVLAAHNNYICLESDGKAGSPFCNSISHCHNWVSQWWWCPSHQKVLYYLINEVSSRPSNRA